MAEARTVTIEVERLEAIIGEAIMLAAWGAGLKGGAQQLWSGKAATPAGIEWAMAKVMKADSGEGVGRG